MKVYKILAASKPGSGITCYEAISWIFLNKEDAIKHINASSHFFYEDPLIEEIDINVISPTSITTYLLPIEKKK